MSSRWKKCKRSKMSQRVKEPKVGWISLNRFTSRDVRAGEGIALQQSSCHVSGDVFVKPITGRFRSLPERKLRELLDQIKEVFSRVGFEPVLDRSQPLWMQAEFLDNLMDFELNPPCGCKSELKKKMRSA